MMEKKAEIEQQEKISELLKQMQEKDIDMKELMQILEKYRPDAEYDFAQRVYDTLTDGLNNDYALSQVENAYEMGSRCSILYDEAIRMCWDISRRLMGNELDNHPDLQLIMDNMTEIQKILCLKMFHYGVMFGRE